VIHSAVMAVRSSSKESLGDPLGSDGCEVDLEGTSE